MKQIYIILAISVAVPLLAWACGPGQNGPLGGYCRDQSLFQKGSNSARVVLDSSEWGPPRSVKGVSGWNNECRPSLTSDGRILVFHADAQNGPPYHPSHVGEWSSVYWAKWTGSRWDSVMPIDSVAGCGGMYPFITRDGSRILFTRAVGGNSDIYVTEWTGTQWDTARSIGPAINTPDADEAYPCLSADGHRLLFASNRVGGYGRRDLYIARWNGSGWDSITNLGPNVNQPGATNWNPFLADGDTLLYFSREQYSMFGPQELWMTHWTDFEWSLPENVGAPVNGCVHICSSFFHPGLNRLFLGGEVSEGSYGDQDIWVSTPASDIMLSQSAQEDQSQPERGSDGWQNTANLDSAWQVYCLLEASDDAIYAGTGPYGQVFRTTDGGNSWNPTGTLSGAMKVYALAEDSRGRLYAGTYPNGDVFRSTDHGANWLSTGDLAYATTVRSVLTVHDTLFAATFPSDDNDFGQVFRSIDDGLTWEPTAPIPEVVGGVLTLARLPNGRMFAGCYSSACQIYLSPDQGEHWAAIDMPMPQSSRDEWTQLWAVEPASRETIFTGGWVHATGGLVWRSTNGGTVWDTVPQRIRIGPVRATKAYDLLALPDGSLLAGVQAGRDSCVWQTYDHGITWSNTGALTGALEALCLIQSRDGTIYAGTTPNGDAFRYSASGIEQSYSSLSATTLTVDATLGSPVISFSVPTPGLCEIAVYNIAGRKVAFILNEPRAAGQYRIVWNRQDNCGRRVPAGSYVLRLATRKGEAFARMLLID